MAMGRPRASTMAWIFVVRPPRERPIACACAPLFRPPPSGVSLGRRAVDGLTIAGIGARQRQTTDAKRRASSSDESDCRPSSKARRRPGNPVTDSRS
jgi:hypothetical protein